MNTKKAFSKKLILDKSTVSQLDTQELEQLKAGGTPWVDTLSQNPVDCGY